MKGAGAGGYAVGYIGLAPRLIALRFGIGHPTFWALPSGIAVLLAARVGALRASGMGH